MIYPKNPLVKRWSGNMNAVLHNSQKPQEIISFFPNMFGLFGKLQ